jgi:hypothetical protein
MMLRIRVTKRAPTIAFLALCAALIAMPTLVKATDVIRVVSDASGERLQVNGRDTMVFGMNWDYFPIGTNYSYNVWGQPDEFIKSALSREMPLMKAMGVNAIRAYVGMPARWITYVYEQYGIYTILNHTVARYGYTLDGIWTAQVDYADPRLREAVKAEVLAMVEEYRNTPGILMWLLGNENNYGLSWTSFEIEALPEGERDTARARFLYSLFGEIIDGIKQLDSNHPVAIANGDIQYVDLIAQECENLDILGTNCYRGISARDLFDVVKSTLGIPVLFTEFGADAFNAKDMREDQIMQARYLIGQWQEIYEMSAGKGRADNCIGGVIFQWTDGWWKFKQDERLDVHDTNASWPNGGYKEDLVEGDNNMNEEWWGITAKGFPDFNGQYDVYPRAAYYALRKAFELDPYAPDTDLEKIRAHFGRIHPVTSALEARGNTAAQKADIVSRVRLSGVRLEFETYYTGGERVSTPSAPGSGTPTEFPAFQGFDQMESFYAEFEAKPIDAVTGRMSVNVLANVPTNPINEIFYENRGRPKTVEGPDEEVTLSDIERVKVYQAEISWDDRWFTLDGFYRTGHLHWQYEGDFFGLYHDAYYGENIDIYNGLAPSGVEIAGKKDLEGLKLAYGPELWWGANPAVFLKYQRRVWEWDATAIYQEDLKDKTTTTTSSAAIPIPRTRKLTLQFKGSYRNIGYEVGGIWAGNPKVGQTFQIAEEDGASYRILQDWVKDSDTFGGKAKVTYQKGRWNWYAQGAIMGLVADGGPQGPNVHTFTGWRLRDSGSGNQSNILTGIAIQVRDFQISPNFLYQKPMVGPVPGDAPAPGRARNVRDDPFAVLANREATAAELLVTYDPTPATWMWSWDNEAREDAKFAAAVGYVFYHLPTTRDATLFVAEDGRTIFAFSAAPPARDHWELEARIVSVPRRDMRLVAVLFVGTGDSHGFDATGEDKKLNRKIQRGGGHARLAWGPHAFEVAATFDDWGPYDYHRDFNETFPVQLMADVSRTLGAPRWFGFPQTKFGVRWTWRSLDQNSPRYCPGKTPDALGNLECDPTLPGDSGSEWEFRTYLHFTL